MDYTFENIPKLISLLFDKLDIIEQKIDTSKANAEPSSKPLTVKEAASYLSLAPGTIYNLIHKGELSPIKKGKRCYFTLDALNEYLAQGKQKSQEEIKNEVHTFLQTQKKSK